MFAVGSTRFPTCLLVYFKTSVEKSFTAFRHDDVRPSSIKSLSFKCLFYPNLVEMAPIIKVSYKLFLTYKKKRCLLANVWKTHLRNLLCNRIYYLSVNDEIMSATLGVNGMEVLVSILGDSSATFLVLYWLYILPI